MVFVDISIRLVEKYLMNRKDSREGLYECRKTERNY